MIKLPNFTQNVRSGHFAKLIFVFYYKCIPFMDDNFWSIFIYMICSLISILATISRFYLPGRPILNEVSTVDTQIEERLD